jgi:hypothetical protein
MGPLRVSRVVVDGDPYQVLRHRLVAGVADEPPDVRPVHAIAVDQFGLLMLHH